MPLVDIPHSEGHKPEDVLKTTEIIRNLTGLCQGFAIPYIRKVLESDAISDEALRLYNLASENISEILETSVSLDKKDKDNLTLSLASLAEENVENLITDEEVSHFSSEFAGTLIRTLLNELMGIISKISYLNLDPSLIPLKEGYRSNVLHQLEESVAIYGISQNEILSILNELALSLASTNLTFRLSSNLNIIFPDEAAQNVIVMSSEEYDKFVYSKRELATRVSKEWLSVMDGTEPETTESLLNRYLVPGNMDKQVAFFKECQKLIHDYEKPYRFYIRPEQKSTGVKQRFAKWFSGDSHLTQEILFLIMSNVNRSMQSTLNRNGLMVVSNEKSELQYMLYKNKDNMGTIVVKVLKRPKSKTKIVDRGECKDISDNFSTAIAATGLLYNHEDKISSDYM